MWVNSSESTGGFVCAEEQDKEEDGDDGGKEDYSAP
jgi:hypothetical protein